MYKYTVYKYYCVLYILIIRYNHLCFLVILLIYNIFTICYTGNMNYDLPVFNYLPNYLHFELFFQIDNFLSVPFDSNEGLDYLTNYETLETSLQEIDYPVTENFTRKSLKYMQWHHLPLLSDKDEQDWSRIYSMIMQTDKGNWTQNFEKFFLKYILGDPGFKEYTPPKYTSWRYLESFYIKYLLLEMKNFTINLKRWDLLFKFVNTRLHSKKQGSYLFRCYDTYLCLYYRWEIIQYVIWSQSLNKRVRWLMQEHFNRKPWVMVTYFLIKSIGGGIGIYIWFHYLPFP